MSREHALLRSRYKNSTFYHIMGTGLSSAQERPSPLLQRSTCWQCREHLQLQHGAKGRQRTSVMPTRYTTCTDDLLSLLGGQKDRQPPGEQQNSSPAGWGSGYGSGSSRPAPGSVQTPFRGEAPAAPMKSALRGAATGRPKIVPSPSHWSHTESLWHKDSGYTQKPLYNSFFQWC